MNLAINNLEIPDYCYHNPSISDINGNTVAMFLAPNGKEIPK